MNDSAMIEEVRTVGVEFPSDFHFLKGFDEHLSLFHLVFTPGAVVLEYMGHGNIKVRLNFLWIDLFGFIEFTDGFCKIILAIS
jgi:hypothetical protein